MSATIQQLPTTGTYAVDKLHSTIGFAVRHNAIATFRSSFADYDAAYTDGVLSGTARVESIEIGLEQFKGHLMSDEFFAAAEHPEIAFRTTSIRVDDDGRAEIDGELTIKGITRPIVATGTAASGPGVSGANVLAFEIEAKVDRREFGLGWQAKLPNGGDALGWDVTLEARLELAEA